MPSKILPTITHHFQIIFAIKRSSFELGLYAQIPFFHKTSRYTHPYKQNAYHSTDHQLVYPLRCHLGSTTSVSIHSLFQKPLPQVSPLSGLFGQTQVAPTILYKLATNPPHSRAQCVWKCRGMHLGDVFHHNFCANII